MRFYNPQLHRFYCGALLHATTMYLCILDRAGSIVLPKEPRPDSLPGKPNRPGHRGLTQPRSPLSEGRAPL
jgi:hypothetical protein